MDTVPFHYVGGHLLVVPVKINDSIAAKFIFDTGIGLNLISKSVLEQLGGTIKGSHVGKRMSGQSLNVPLSSISSLSLGQMRRSNVPIGAWDLNGFFPNTGEFSGIEGFLSLDFLKDQPFTLDYGSGQVVIENDQSLRKRLSAGVAVPIGLDRQDVALSVFLQLSLPGKNVAKVEVDTGSNSLILDEKYLSLLGKFVNSADTETKHGKDETGHSYARHFTKISGIIYPVAAPKITQQDPSVMFQKIIYDGLIGDSFLRQFSVTFDLPSSRMIFSRRWQ